MNPIINKSSVDESRTHPYILRSSKLVLEALGYACEYVNWENLSVEGHDSHFTLVYLKDLSGYVKIQFWVRNGEKWLNKYCFDLCVRNGYHLVERMLKLGLLFIDEFQFHDVVKEKFSYKKKVA